MAHRLPELLRRVELGASKPTEYGIGVNIEWEKIHQSASVPTVGAKVILRGLVLIPKSRPRICLQLAKRTKTRTSNDEDQHEGEIKTDEEGMVDTVNTMEEEKQEGQEKYNNNDVSKGKAG